MIYPLWPSKNPIRKKYPLKKAQIGLKIILDNDSILENDFLIKQDLMIVSLDSWKNLLDSRSDWLSGVPSVLIIKA